MDGKGVESKPMGSRRRFGQHFLIDESVAEHFKLKYFIKMDSATLTGLSGGTLTTISFFPQ